jgi:predicted transcriptional regulator of viral defense system
MKLSEYLTQLSAHGRCCFTLNEAEKSLKKSRQSILLSLEHLKKNKRIASPAKGFYVIVTPEYQRYDCLPPEYFIPYLMEYWQCPYYAALLTAAAYHEASHQAAQVFQIVIEKKRREIRCGKVRVQFITKHFIHDLPTQNISTSKSILKISTPEVTAMDLLRYPHRSGGLNHIATVLAELQEKMRPKELAVLLNTQSDLAWKQRLGYLLEKLGAQKLADIVGNNLMHQKRISYIPLMPGSKFITTAQPNRNTRWKIIENATVESDL